MARCPRPALVSGLTLCAIALGGLSIYGLGAHYYQYVWTLPVMGVAMGLSFTPVSVAVLERVPGPKAGMASAVTNTMRELGVDAGHTHQVVAR